MIVALIPTITNERIPFLLQMVKSIQTGTYKDVHPIIISDGNPHVYHAAKKRLNNVSVILNEKRIGWPATINKMVKELNAEYFIYASDDLIFPEDCIEQAMKTMKKCFPDGFGLISLGKKNRSAFGLFGSAFADHFPDRQVLCPDYFHYGGDSELYVTAMHLKAFAYPKKRESQVLHARMKDDCWRMARKSREKDHKIYRLREKKGFVWGIDFNLISGEKKHSESDSKRQSQEGEGNAIG